jgi:hypothetical protein
MPPNHRSDDWWWTTAESPGRPAETYLANEMKSRPVSRVVNSPAKDEPGLIEPIVLA